MFVFSQLNIGVWFCQLLILHYLNALLQHFMGFRQPFSMMSALHKKVMESKENLKENMSNFSVITVSADDLGTVWCQEICRHSDDQIWVLYIYGTGT